MIELLVLGLLIYIISIFMQASKECEQKAKLEAEALKKCKAKVRGAKIQQVYLRTPKIKAYYTKKRVKK